MDEETVENIYRKGFENGLEQAWECARKLCQSEKYGGLEENCAEIFDRQDTFDVFDYSASEAIAKIKEYEQKQTDEMSMEEAIHILNNLKPTNTKSSFDAYVVGKALTMAIKALEQEPCKVSEYDKDHIWYKGWQYISLRRFLEVKAEAEQEPSGDLISRQAVQDYIAKYLSQYLYNDVREAVEVIDEYIGELPSVKQEQKTGHWEWVQYDYNPKLGNWHCSECRCVVVECVNKWEEGGIPLYKYCPQCGARIVEPQERSDKE